MSQQKSQLDRLISHQQRIVSLQKSSGVALSGEPERTYRENDKAILVLLESMRGAEKALPVEPVEVRVMRGQQAEGYKQHYLGITTYIDALRATCLAQAARLNDLEITQSTNPCRCVPDGDDGTLRLVCSWHEAIMKRAAKLVYVIIRARAHARVAGVISNEAAAKQVADRLDDEAGEIGAFRIRAYPVHDTAEEHAEWEKSPDAKRRK